LAARGIALVLGDPKRPLSLVHVSDVVTCIVRAASATGAEGRTYFVSDGAVHTWAGVVETLARTLGRTPRRLRIGGGVLRLAAVIEESRASLTGRRPLLTRERLIEFRAGAWVCDASRAREELGLEPRFGLEEGFATTAAWYREQKWL
jgi:nucleoside-diphosphate-sugar epimerase